MSPSYRSGCSSRACATSERRRSTTPSTYATASAPFRIRDHPLSLVWDERVRLDGWLAEYLGSERSDYTARIGRVFLIGWWPASSSRVARASTCLGVTPRTCADIEA